ncbi:MAG TPA: rhomboid family intramembrane serine protease [Gammaproteobacteria bacterium]|nr:rhomboid family intramembrane serine protease [Gammaproteobacteria bacterium]
MIPLRDDNPTMLRPIATVAIIVVCTLVFLWQIALPKRAEQEVVYALGLIPAVLLGNGQLPEMLRWVPAPLTIFTSMFLHGGFLHIAGNMLYLWIFGDNVEDRMGHGRFVLFYLICGVVAALSQALPAPDSTVPMIGASGAISGVLGASLLLYPRANVLVVIPIIIIPYTLRLPAVVVLGMWFVLQLLSSLAGGGASVAFRAHVGGFVAGMLLLRLFMRRGPPIRQLW